MKRSITILGIAIVSLLTLVTQAEVCRYRVWLTDKNESTYSTDRPEEFMSPAGIERRKLQGIAFDTHDLPVNTQYIRQIEDAGGTIIVTSRWMNTAVIACEDTTAIKQLPFVSHIECVWSTPDTIIFNTQHNENSKFLHSSNNSSTSQVSHELSYGVAWEQVSMLNIDSLHQAGYAGQGMTIAVVDAGFRGLDNITAIDKNRIIGRYDLLKGTFDNTGSDHGTSVLSCMAANNQGIYVGTAPEADYILIITEDVPTEHAFEEDMWVRGIELADSLGAQIINSSLCYTRFDEEWMSYTAADLDGHTAFSTRGANIAARKGLLIVAAAGNDYLNSWRMIGFPSDAENILTVGAVSATGNRCSFSSEGYVNDRDVKPNIVAMGGQTLCYKKSGEIEAINGTSFATPLITGCMACLWQALPHLSVPQLIDLIEKSASLYHSPNALLGHGIPDFYAAYNSETGIESPLNNNKIYIGGRTLYLPATTARSVVILYNISGNKVWETTPPQGSTAIELQGVDKGLYIVTVSSPKEHNTTKILIH